MKLLHLFAAALMVFGIGAIQPNAAQAYAGPARAAVFTGGTLTTTDVQYRRDGRGWDNRDRGGRGWDRGRNRGWNRGGYNRGWDRRGYRGYRGHYGYRGCRTFYRYGRPYRVCR